MISLIVAMDKNNLIGGNNKLLWHIAKDLQYFKEVTTGKVIIMGRKTYESIGRPLPNRTNVIISRDKSLEIEGCEVFNDIDMAIKAYPEAIIIGGANIYKQVMDKVDKMYITLVEGEYKGDAYFPKVDEGEWLETRWDPHEGHTFIVKERR